MIYVTIGTQLPFDRLIRIMDELAPQLDEEIIAQVYKCDFKPKHIKTVDFLAPDKFTALFDSARLIVSHAGIGTILTALQKDKPIIIFPRIAALGEHRNEHQLATAKRFKEMGVLNVAMDEKELTEMLLSGNLAPQKHIGRRAAPSLIQAVEDFIESEE